MKKNLSAATLGFIIMLVIMRFQGAALNTPVSPLAIIDLEFADTPERVLELFSHWDLPVAKMNIWLDFIFIMSYVYFFSVAAETMALKWPEPHVFRQTGLFLARVVFAAGIFDVVENLLMLQTVSNNYTQLSLQLTYYCAAFKFILIGLVIIYFIIALPASIKK